MPLVNPIVLRGGYADFVARVFFLRSPFVFALFTSLIPPLPLPLSTHRDGASACRILTDARTKIYAGRDFATRGYPPPAPLFLRDADTRAG